MNMRQRLQMLKKCSILASDKPFMTCADCLHLDVKNCECRLLDVFLGNCPFKLARVGYTESEGRLCHG